LVGPSTAVTPRPDRIRGFGEWLGEAGISVRNMLKTAST